MRADEIHPEGCGGQAGRSVGALIRAAADAELTAEELSAFERLCAEHDCTQDRVKFEQTLRACCGRVMTMTPACSDSLRQRIRAMAEQTRDAPAAEPSPTPSLTAGVAAEPVSVPAEAVSLPERMAGSTRSVSFWRQSPGMAAAAALLLSVAGVLVWQAARHPSVAPPAGMTHQQVSYRDQVAGFLAGEHQRCCRSDRAAQAKLVHRDLPSARAHFATAFGVDPDRMESVTVEAGEMNFWGGGDCHVPGSTRSAHLRFDAVSPEGESLRLSLFVMPDNQRLPMQDGVTYRLNAAACDRAGVAVYAWRDQGLMYLLVSEAKGEFCGMVRRAMKAPAQIAGL